MPTLNSTGNPQWRPVAPKSVGGRPAKVVDPNATSNADRLKDETLMKLQQFIKNMQINQDICSTKLEYFEFTPQIDWARMPQSPDRIQLADWLERMGKKNATHESEYLNAGVKVLGYISNYSLKG